MSKGIVLFISGLIIVGLVSFIFNTAIASAFFSETQDISSSGYNFDKWTFTEDLHNKHRSMTLTHTWNSPSSSSHFEQEGWGNTNFAPIIINQPPRNSEVSLNDAFRAFDNSQLTRFRAGYYDYNNYNYYRDYNTPIYRTYF